MKLTPTGKRFVHDGPADRFGVYMWEMPNGAYLSDADRNFLSINSEFGDLKRITELKNAVRSFGITEGQPKFFPGHRKVTEEEYQEQLWRAGEGLVPDPDDVNALADDLKYRGMRND